MCASPRGVRTTSGAEHWIAPRSSLRPLLPESGLRVEATLSLNDAQRRAVEHRGGALLVVAGAGSGKTRVLAARVARLLADGVRPEAGLAFTVHVQGKCQAPWCRTGRPDY